MEAPHRLTLKQSVTVKFAHKTIGEEICSEQPWPTVSGEARGMGMWSQARRAAPHAVQSAAGKMSISGVAIASVYAVISLSGLIGNITLIKTFCTAKCARNVPNVFMSSLALGDVVLLLTCAPVDASRYLSEEWLFGRVGCKVIPFIQLTSVGVSVFTLTALSADR